MNSKRFDNAISALVEAYLHGTLAAGTCVACAVGNMIAKASGMKIQPNNFNPYDDYNQTLPQWGAALLIARHRCAFVTPDELQIQIDNVVRTGYSLEEIERIETAFENNTHISFRQYSVRDDQQIDTDQYNGLMAVVDVLCELEGISDVQTYKDMFVKELA